MSKHPVQPTQGAEEKLTNHQIAVKWSKQLGAAYSDCFANDPWGDPAKDWKGYVHYIENAIEEALGDVPPEQSDEDVAWQIFNAYEEKGSEEAEAILAPHVQARTTDLRQHLKDLLDWCVDPSTWKDDVKDAIVAKARSAIGEHHE